MITKNAQQATITEEEAELYDRQIRLWGLDSQKRLRQAKVLLCGLGSLGTEVAKNVILAGVKSLTLMDNASVTKEDIATNFTIVEEDMNKNRAVAAMANIQKLNPMVEVSSSASNVDEEDEEFFQQFDVVCVLGCSQKTAEKVDRICRRNNIHFITGDSFGFFGFAFFDFGIHEYSEEVKKTEKEKEEEDTSTNGEPAAKKIKISEEETVTKKKISKYTVFADSINTSDDTRKSAGLFDLIKIIWHFKDTHKSLPHPDISKDQMKHLEQKITQVDKSKSAKSAVSMENVLNHSDGEFAPTCAIIGGVIGQEVIKAVSQKDAPLNNFFLFDGIEGSGYVNKQSSST